MKYQPFIIDIGLCHGGDVCVTAQFMGVTRTHRTAWDDLPLSPEELSDAADWLERGHIDPAYQQELGGRLFRLLFQGDVLQLLHDACARLNSEEGLRLLMRLPIEAAQTDASASELVRLPWELMYDEQYGYLALSRTVPLVYHDPSADLPNRVPDGSTSLRVLLITASPEGTDPLQSAQEVDAIIGALTKGDRVYQRLRLIGRHIVRHGTLRGLPGRLRGLRRFEVTTLTDATRRNIRQSLDEARGKGEPYHIIHFVGHGEYRNGKSYLSLNSENKEGSIDEITGEDFIQLIADPDLYLLIINACQTAPVNAMLASVTEKAMLRGAPVVIGMRMKVFDDAAIYFARDFYRSLAAGEPVEAAMATSRQLTKREAPGQAADWSIPRMFMGWSEGLTLPEMTVRRLTLLQLTLRGFLSLVAVLGIVGTLVGVPTLMRTLATEVPGIKCLNLYPMDENKFTVAFYPFGVVDESGQYILTNDGRDLAQFLFNRLELNFEDLDLDIPYELRPPAHACAIRGKDGVERAQRAAEIAEDINADVLIFGTITDANVDPRLKLEFHVSYKGFEEGEEIAGPYALGSSLKVNRPFDPEELLIIYRPAHLVRVEILSQIVLGLSYLSADEFRLALRHFKSAADTEQWADSDGKESVYLLLGRTYLRLADRENKNEYLQQAYDNYNRALALGLIPGRAQLGLASIESMRALGDLANWDPDNFDEELLQRAEAAYKEILDEFPDEVSTDVSDEEYRIVEAKVNFGLGVVNFNRWLCCDIDAWSESAGYFEKVIDTYQEYQDGRLKSRASWAYGYMGYFTLRSGESRKSINYYKRAINLAGPRQLILFNGRLAEAYCQNNEPNEALAALQGAKDTATIYGYVENVDEYAKLMVAFEECGCKSVENDIDECTKGKTQ